MAVFGTPMLVVVVPTDAQVAEAIEDRVEALPAGEPGAAERSERPL